MVFSENVLSVTIVIFAFVMIGMFILLSRRVCVSLWSLMRVNVTAILCFVIQVRRLSTGGSR